MTGLTKMEEARALLHELEKRKGISCHYYFCKYHLGYKEMRPKPHKELSEFLAVSNKRKKHIELPRGSFKSTHTTIGYTLHQVAKNPDIRVLIDNEVYGNSKAFLREIKGHMENKELTDVYPNLIPNKTTNDGWTESSIIVKARTRPLKEPTISCAGLDQIKVGMHYDLIIMDDLVSPRNTTTVEQIEKVIDHYRLALSLLEPNGELIIIGTRYHYSDLYGYLLEYEADTFDHYIKPAVNPDGSLLFPERLTHDFLQEQRVAQGSYIFNCQYMLDPVDQDSAEFKQDWLRKYRGRLVTRNGKRYLRVEWVSVDERQVPYEVPIKIYAAIDPASKKRKRSDWTVLIVLAVTPNNEWLILDITRDKLNPKEKVDLIFNTYKIWNFDLIGIETVGFQDTLKFYCIQRMKEDNIFFRIVEVSTGNKKKEDRILSVQPRFQRGHVFLPKIIRKKDYTGKTKSLIEAFEDEYMFFPLAKTDDIMDTISFFEIIIPNKKRQRSKRRKGRAALIKGRK